MGRKSSRTEKGNKEFETEINGVKVSISVDYVHHIGEDSGSYFDEPEAWTIGLKKTVDEAFYYHEEDDEYYIYDNEEEINKFVNSLEAEDFE
jgi:hypothetical protein